MLYFVILCKVFWSFFFFFFWEVCTKMPASAAERLSSVFLYVIELLTMTRIKRKPLFFLPPQHASSKFSPDVNAIFGPYSSQGGLVVTLWFKVGLTISKLLSHLGQICKTLLSDVHKADVSGLAGGTPLTYARMMMMVVFGHSRGQVKPFLHLGLGSLVVSSRLSRPKKNVLILAKNLQNEERAEERLADPAWFY